MRVHDQGAFFRVTASAQEVYQWSRRWPCADLPDKGISCTFDKRNGDLVDITEGFDNEAASALSQDLAEYGMARLVERPRGRGAGRLAS